jgi:hypothetical protein
MRRLLLSGRDMSQRHSGYARVPNDDYRTPPWVVQALVPHIDPRPPEIWDPAAGADSIAQVLRSASPRVAKARKEATGNNLPVERIGKNGRKRGRTDFDHAKTRQHLFACPQFAKKLALTNRIRWISAAFAEKQLCHLTQLSVSGLVQPLRPPPVRPSRPRRIPKRRSAVPQAQILQRPKR